jgi:hypothetical protein
MAAKGIMFGVAFKEVFIGSLRRTFSPSLLTDGMTIDF